MKTTSAALNRNLAREAAGVRLTQRYLIKGNSPTRDDIFRYKVNLEEKQVGDKIIFLNAGAYNYTTDFFGYKKLETVIEE